MSTATAAAVAQRPPVGPGPRSRPSVAGLVLRVAAGTALFVAVLVAARAEDARIAGMMLTFPALNGISLMMAPVADKRAMARAMLAVIALNGIVALAFIALLYALALVQGPVAAAGWVWPASGLAFVVWLAACWVLSRAPPRIERGFLLACLAAAPVLAAVWWVACPQLAAPPAAGDAPGFLIGNAERIALFALTLALLLVAAEWLGASGGLLGRLGAFPLLPLFSLASIAGSDAGAGIARLSQLRPAILLGLLLAMAFAWLYAGYLMRAPPPVPQRGQAWPRALAGLLVGWLICVGIIFAGMAAVAAVEGCRRG